ncbi:MAG: TolC family protein, partial [Pseudomonadota bacterium]
MKPLHRACLASLILALVFSGCLVQPDRHEYASVRRAAFPAPEPGRGTPGGGRLPVPGEPVDVARAVAIALANNPDAAMATERIRRSAAMTAQARAAFMPMVSVYGEYVQGNAPSGYLFKTMDQRLLAPQVNFNDPGWFENWEAGASARVNLFSGGSQWLGYRMARKGEAAARLSRGEVRNTLSATVVEAF